jgi:hypothetical protein
MRTQRDCVQHPVRVTDPPMTRGRGRHPGSIILGILALLYTGNLFGIIHFGFLDNLYKTLYGYRDMIAGPGSFVLQFAILLIVLFLLYTLIMPFVRRSRMR